ncbi:aldose epimerase family protein [Pontibacter silvestris]|uniref:Aldose 1-epimerase n=1 Tax=Pontibacter silvestris TaxID=2305183 RepID=A0ABW4X034_9BACT|nr:aldose epimerase family protein [Pontibacter silvestris]MCC9135355.1 galactose mutarotase [Pontibacter silvestris]
MKIKKDAFGTTTEGTETSLYTLNNETGMEIKVSDYGATITSILAHDKDGKPGDVVLGFDHVSGYQSEAYLKSNPYFGAAIGRFGNRIARGKFTLDGEEYTLATNNGPNHLHGGNKGFDKVVWKAEPLEEQNAIRFTYVSADGEEGYPGTLTTTVTYTLSSANELKIDYKASTTKATPINLTNHTYFNLAAGKLEDALNHVLTLHANKYTVVDESFIPTGENRDVTGTPMDFRTPEVIGSRIEQVPGGYDHNYVLQDKSSALKLAATVFDPATGRTLEVYTTEPGVQFYTGNFLDGTLTGKGNITYKKRYGFCLETQHFPDSPNQPDFPSTILRPDDTYTSSTVYRFSVKDQAS